MLMLFCAVAALIIFLILCILLIVFPYDYSWKFRRSDTKKIEMIPGPKTLPFFGNILQFNVPPDRTYKFRAFSQCTEDEFKFAHKLRATLFLVKKSKIL
jgi:hypothetical protein